MGARAGDASILFAWGQPASKNNGSRHTRSSSAAEETRPPSHAHFRSNHSGRHSCCYSSNAFATALKSTRPITAFTKYHQRNIQVGHIPNGRVFGMCVHADSQFREI